MLITSGKFGMTLEQSGILPEVKEGNLNIFRYYWTEI